MGRRTAHARSRGGVETEGFETHWWEGIDRRLAHRIRVQEIIGSADKRHGPRPTFRTKLVPSDVRDPLTRWSVDVPGSQFGFKSRLFSSFSSFSMNLSQGWGAWIISLRRRRSWTSDTPSLDLMGRWRQFIPLSRTTSGMAFRATNERGRARDPSHKRCVTVG